MSDKNGIPHPDVFPGLYPTKEMVLREVSSYFNLEVKDLYKKTREAQIVEPRHIVISILKYALEFTNDQLSFEFSQTNASTVHARRNVMNFYTTDRVYRNRLNEIMKRLFSSEIERESIIARMTDPEMDKGKVGGISKLKIQLV